MNAAYVKTGVAISPSPLADGFDLYTQEREAIEGPSTPSRHKKPPKRD